MDTSEYYGGLYPSPPEEKIQKKIYELFEELLGDFNE